MDKTKVMVFERHTESTPEIKVAGQRMECVDEFVYLGSLFTKDNDSTAEVKRRINLASETMGSLSTLCKSK